ncbi:hypothetical protein R1T08_21910 [Streptomyces sp. SBC-4]|nr:hypothetical protein [Streptomyces sp. SBC-4]MDV5146770.1 hypothetical protein [Streptomyces sp. SBC-4]
MTTSLEPTTTGRGSGRPLDQRVLLPTPHGLAYADERDEDRSVEGVLLAGAGAQAVSQRTAMERLLCRVCSGPAARTGNGALWLLPFPMETPDDLWWDGWPEGTRITEPPVCFQHSSPPRTGIGHRAFFAAEAEIVGGDRRRAARPRRSPQGQGLGDASRRHRPRRPPDRRVPGSCEAR